MSRFSPSTLISSVLRLSDVGYERTCADTPYKGSVGASCCAAFHLARVLQDDLRAQAEQTSVLRGREVCISHGRLCPQPLVCMPPGWM